MFENRMRKLLHDLRFPYSLIRSRFDVTSSTAFATCLTKPAESFKSWMNFEELKALQLFSWDPPTKLSIPFDALPDKTKQVLIDAQHIKDIGTWVFSLSVAFPHLLDKSEMQTLLQLTIADRHYDVLFRDEKIDFKSEITKSTKDYILSLKTNPSSVLAAPHLLLAKVSKILQTKDGVKALEKRHLAVQTWLTLGIKDLIFTFCEVPGAIAPKLPIVFGILHKIKHEILWAVVHCSSYKGNGSSKQRFWRKFCHFPELLSNSYKLSAMVLKYKSLIYDYYDQLIEMDLVKLNEELRILEDSHSMDGSVKNLVYNITNKLNEFQKIEDHKDKQYSSIRLDCYRVQCAMSNTSAIHSRNKAQSDSFLKRLKKICDESRFAESIETELKHCSPFRMLWYYPVSLLGLFDVLMDITTVKTEQELKAMRFETTASRNISRYWNVFIRIWYVFASLNSILPQIHSLTI